LEVRSSWALPINERVLGDLHCVLSGEVAASVRVLQISAVFCSTLPCRSAFAVKPRNKPLAFFILSRGEGAGVFGLSFTLHGGEVAALAASAPKLSSALVGI